jgi:hypothetical protein
LGTVRVVGGGLAFAPPGWRIGTLSNDDVFERVRFW